MSLCDDKIVPKLKYPMQEGGGVLKTNAGPPEGVRLWSNHYYSLGGCTDTGAAARDRHASRSGTWAASSPGENPLKTWGCFGVAPAGTRETETRREQPPERRPSAYAWGWDEDRDCLGSEARKAHKKVLVAQ